MDFLTLQSDVALALFAAGGLLVTLLSIAKDTASRRRSAGPALS